MIWIYRTAPSNSAVSLCEVLGAKRLRAHCLNRVRDTDHVVCWGESWPSSSERVACRLSRWP
jgi:hypothetical protein